MKYVIAFSACFAVAYFGAYRINYTATDQTRAVVHQVCPAGGKAMVSAGFEIPLTAAIVKAQPVWKQAGFCIITMWK